MAIHVQFQGRTFPVELEPSNRMRVRYLNTTRNIRGEVAANGTARLVRALHVQSRCHGGAEPDQLEPLEECEA